MDNQELVIPVKSPNDKRDYRVIRLTNGMQALLISDLKSPRRCHKKVDLPKKQVENRRRSLCYPTTPEKLMRVDGECDSACSERRVSASLDVQQKVANVDSMIYDAHAPPVGHYGYVRQISAPAGLTRRRPQNAYSSAQDNCQFVVGSPTKHTEMSIPFKANDHILFSAAKEAPTMLSPPLEEEETKLAAVGLCVNVGALSDPDEIPGLAHFLEHMVFMGSEAYPNENDFDEFIKKHGGETNGQTDFDCTVFTFEIQPDYLEEALDRFVNFFKSPLLKESAVDREIQAVDSEYQICQQSDEMRLTRLLQSIATPGHPLAHFDCGNQETLKDTPERENIDRMALLKAFFLKYYVSQRMTLAICSPASLDDLEKTVRRHFSGIRQSSQTQDDPFMDLRPFQEVAFHKLYYVLPVHDVNQLELQWVIPCQEKNYRFLPDSYLSWLIGHECSGSVMYLLKQKGYATSTCVGVDNLKYCSIFSCAIELTDDGLEHVAEVVHTVFQYVHMLKRVGPSREMFEEMQKIRANNFLFLDLENPWNLVECLSQTMRSVAGSDILTAYSLMHEFKPQLVEEILDCLSLESVRITLSSKSFGCLCDQTERWYKVQYHCADIPGDWIHPEFCAYDNPFLHLPRKNRFIASHFDVKEVANSTVYPVVIEESEYGRLWFKQDDKFHAPKAAVCMTLLTPVTNESVHSCSCGLLFESIFAFVVQELSYEASCAALSSEVDVVNNGLALLFYGLSDKLMDYFKEVINALVNFAFTTKVFIDIKNLLQRNLKNFVLDPEDLNSLISTCLLVEKEVSNFELLAALEVITEEDVKSFAKRLLSAFYVESLIQGNVSAEEARQYHQYIRVMVQQQPLPKSLISKARCAIIPEGRTVCRHCGMDKTNPNTCVTTIYQVGPVTLKEHMLSLVLTRLMEEPCFNILRTQYQLGYNVFQSSGSTCGTNAVSVTVVADSGKFTADQVVEKIAEFFSRFEEMLVQYSPEHFSKYITSLIKHRKLVDLSLYDEVERNWLEVSLGRYMFNCFDKEIECLESITQDDVVKWMRKHFLDSASSKVLSIQVLGQHETSASEHVDESASDDEADEESGSDSVDSDSDTIACATKLGWNFQRVDNPHYDRVILHIMDLKKTGSFYPYSFVQ